ncbi:MAG: hypothetical protein EOR30_23725 [Mesorhizobium sp.]|nr:hypothetical protein EOA78_23325 [Mesorhizobium sp. M5C.F.Cr.IN.023.01.1.1]RWF85709.1 MAG: hypothetical protein EOQ36_21265 [Mesorhizobium sp.]RWF95834.1 MAG: hypothetical protein EOQ45_06905 [Mesorhizobium sp.]RWI38253.1 MAG: hypothetical protein EOR14_23095 [Mesorhizobium sp.]RWI46312.1 MAG: hypothetical protein EOR15_18455 [Mesorhizobium sp.]
MLAGAVMRFLPIQEPTNTWAVFDTTVDVPADFAGTCLIGLTRERAEWLAARANQDASVRSNWIGRLSSLEPEHGVVPYANVRNGLYSQGRFQ